jgi:hypothetical protein
MAQCRAFLSRLPSNPVKFVTRMPSYHQIIQIELTAPLKPALGAPCNGCGVCCLLEPCPLGVVLSGRRQGACVAVRWQGDQHQYRCGALMAPADVLAAALPRPLKSWGPWLAPSLARLANRWIAVGQGCDSTVELTIENLVGATEEISTPSATGNTP